MDILDGEAMIPTSMELIVLAVGCVVSLIVSLLVIKALMEYVRKRSFAVFGAYRIVLGALVLGYFLLK
jgi:undecaprenyl-diphosphatase